LEIFMFLRIATRYFGYKLTNWKAILPVILLVVALLVISSILTLVFGFILGTLAWMIGLGWLVKMVVAGLVIWGLGEAAIYGLDKIAGSHKPA